MEISLTKNLTV